MRKHSTPRHRKPKLGECIKTVMPRNRPFTVNEIMVGLKMLDPKREWVKRAVQNHMHWLRKTGVIRKIKRARNHQPAVYARIGVYVAPQPFEGMTFLEAIRSVLKEPMCATGITLALIEGSYETCQSRKWLRKNVMNVLRYGSFTQNRSGRWTQCQLALSAYS